MSYLRFLCAALLTCVAAVGQVTPQLQTVVDYPHLKFDPEVIEAPDCLQVPKLLLDAGRPCTQAEVDQWFTELQQWRSSRRIRMGYSDALYAKPVFKWTQTSYVQPQMMMQDRYFYDPVAQRYTVDRYLDDLDRRYGGIDSALIWHTYTNIGVDNRNQYDLLRDMPGGVEGVRKMVANFHRRGVKVFFPVMLWDQGTRDEGKPNWIATAEMMKLIDADGVNGDTLDGIPRVFETAAEDIGHPLALEPEHFPGNDEMLAWNTLTWGYWTYPYAPSVSRSKWLEPRAMVHLSARWNHSHIDSLQSAFLNGVGFESWENVWGLWNGMTPRDGEALRRIATLERTVAPFLVSPDWQPYYMTRAQGIFASRFPLGNQTVWTLVNRSDYEVNRPLVRVPWDTAAHYYDLYHGVELTPKVDQGLATLTFSMEEHGYGAVLMTREALDSRTKELLSTMQRLTKKPLVSFSDEWHFLPQRMVRITATKPPGGDPPGMVKIPAGDFDFVVSGNEIEGHDDVGIDVQYPFEPSPRRHHEHIFHMAPFWIDQFPVTNEQYKRFLDATHYRPADPANFLRDWVNTTYPAGWQDKPVTWVSLEDARAYASWAGKRLPHEWEWQYAAQGTDGRLYPWGNQWNAAAVPVPDKGRTMRGPDDVHVHENGASPFQVQDLVGNVWQWTDEFEDDHTRAAVVRGGSYYRPQGTIWYFPQAYRNDEHGKFLLMSPSEDRSAAIGFRCVMDTSE